jgi:hypothetical protein
MSLEYAIEFPCEMRRQYGERRLRALGRSGALVSRIVSQTLETDQAPSRESIEFTTSLSDDLDQAEAVATFCREHCPAHLEAHLEAQPDSFQDFSGQETSAPGSTADNANDSEPVGCLGRIRYPIEARFEQFLAARVQLLCDTVRVEEWPNLLRILVDPECPFDGELTKELRRVTTEEGLRFFELRTPITLARSAAQITTDHVFDLFSGFSSTDDGQSGYERELPLAALPDYRDFLTALLLKELTSSEIARLRERGATYSQFLRFTKAIGRAESLGVRLLMD